MMRQGVAEALAPYADIAGMPVAAAGAGQGAAAPAGANSLAPATPGAAAIPVGSAQAVLALKKGLTLTEVEALLGPAASANEVKEGSMTVMKRGYTADGKRISTSFVGGVLIDYEEDLYYVTIDGQTAVRLTSAPGPEKHATFDPQGKFVAFVRDGNLYVVDVATQTERALTTDGGGLIRNGEADWVYFEEVLNRRWKLFWWSPDSSAWEMAACWRR